MMRKGGTCNLVRISVALDSTRDVLPGWTSWPRNFGAWERSCSGSRGLSAIEDSPFPTPPVSHPSPVGNIRSCHPVTIYYRSSSPKLDDEEL